VTERKRERNSEGESERVRERGNEKMIDERARLHASLRFCFFNI